MDKCCKIAAVYISTLKAIYIIHQHNHWTTSGSGFYGDHQLFQRLYESAQKDLDLAAEKFIGLFGSECLNFALQTKLLNNLLNRYKPETANPFASSLAVEKDFIKLCKDAYNCFEEEGNLTLGLDDAIMSISSNREEALYLLQQSMKDNQ